MISTTELINHTNKSLDKILVERHLEQMLEPLIIQATQRQEYAINVHMNIVSAQDVAIQVLHDRGYKTSIDNEHDSVHIYW